MGRGIGGAPYKKMGLKKNKNKKKLDARSYEGQRPPALRRS